MLRGVSDNARRSLSNWLVEGLLIVISVLLGFAVAQYGERRADAELKAKALASLRAELEHNLAAVEPYVAFHTAFADALEKAEAAPNRESGFQVYLRVPADRLRPHRRARRGVSDAATPWRRDQPHSDFHSSILHPAMVKPSVRLARRLFAR
jgi:hypothetical protein